MSILRNLVQMTGLRDHFRLERSILATLAQLPHVSAVRSLELLTHRGSTWLRPRTWQVDNDFVHSEHDFLSDPRLQSLDQLPALAACIAQEQTQASQQVDAHTHVLWLPVWVRGHVQLCIEVTQPAPPSEHEWDVLEAVFCVYQNYQSLLDYSERDALTGLLNRKTFDEYLQRFCATAPDSRSNEPSSLSWIAVVDIDHFKKVNDQFGHLFGDEVLILTANLLSSSFAPPARIFRFGGEEFVVLLPPMSSQTASEVLENFRQAIAHHCFPQVGSVTVSIGFTGTRPSPAVELLGEADQALYYAKGNGRNQVQMFEHLHNQGLLLKPHISHNNAELF